MPKRALWFICAVILAGAGALAVSLADGLRVTSPAIFSGYLALAILASLFKMRLPGIEGTYSLNTAFILFGLYYLSPGETIVAGCAAVTVQSLWGARQRPTPLQTVFNIANVALSVGTAFAVTHIDLLHDTPAYRPALMAAAAFVQFAVNTLLVSGILSLLQGERVSKIWERWYEWSLPLYVIAAVLVGLLPAQGRMAGPGAWIVLLPLLYLVHFFYILSIGAKPPAVAARASAAEGKQVTPSRGTQLYLSAVLAFGVVLLAKAAVNFDGENPARFLACLTLGLLVSTWKVRLPGMDATISIGFVVTLFAIAELPFSQAVTIGAATCAAQSLWRSASRPSPLQTVFSVGSLVISTALAYGAVRGPLLPGDLTRSVTAKLVLATFLLFAVNTLMVSAAISLTSSKALLRTWSGLYFWFFPYYMAGASAAALMVATSRAAGWLPSVMILPLMGMIYLSYRYHVAKSVTQAVRSQRDTLDRLASEPNAGIA